MPSWQTLTKRICSVVAVCSSVAFGTTYYVASTGGNDSAAGTSISAPWQTLAKVNATTFLPGDTILLKSGSVWTGQLWPKGSGTPGHPIVVDKYQGTIKPIVNGNGLFDDAVKLRNQSFWELNNLEVTNKGASAALRVAIRVWSIDSGTVSHIYIRNMYVHDVNGVNNFETGKRSGGIAVEVDGSVTPSTFDTVLIENCLVRKTDRTGIWSYSPWMNRGGRTTGSGAWYPITNLIIRNNVVDSSGGDGITVRVAKSPLIERNLVKNAAAADKNWCAGMWPFNCDDALFQYNEACSTHTTNDGQGFDCDWLCNRTIFQYNYSHDNDGGFMLICCDGGNVKNFNDGSIVRFNVSVNDGAKVFKIAGTATNTRIYNNTIYTKQGTTGALFNFEGWNGSPKDSYIYNNIFEMKGSYSINLGGNNNVFDYNVWHGIGAPADAHSITQDPLLASPGMAPMGLDNLSGYKITSHSPAKGSGMLLQNMGSNDFWGTSLLENTPIDRGAHQLSSEITTSIAQQWKAIESYPKKKKALILSSDHDAASIDYELNGRMVNKSLKNIFAKKVVVKKNLRP